MVIDINESDGNVFAILGYAKRWNKEEKNENLQEILDNFSKMTYNNIVDGIENATNGEISFINKYW